MSTTSRSTRCTTVRSPSRRGRAGEGRRQGGLDRLPAYGAVPLKDGTGIVLARIWPLEALPHSQ